MSEIPLEPMPIDDFRPTVADVAALLRARTKDVNGEEVGTFNDDTRPTSAQVITLIERACADVQVATGVSPPPYLAEGARSAAAVGTACYIEKSYYPEQVRSDRSAYQYYADEYDKQVQALRTTRAVPRRAPAACSRLRSPSPASIPRCSFSPRRHASSPAASFDRCCSTPGRYPGELRRPAPMPGGPPSTPVRPARGVTRAPRGARRRRPHARVAATATLG
jgi:hypothetical protein